MSALAYPTPTVDVAPLLAPFAPITLSEMQSVALLDRIDTKFVFGISQLPAVLHALRASYRVLNINGARVNRYQTLYFDTPNFALYHQHHNGVSARYKVRERRYVESDLSFLEVKRRTNQARTIKTRIPIDDIDLRFDAPASDFVQGHTPYDGSDLEPKLWNDYLRVTLVSTRREERLTLDLDLAFRWGSTQQNLPGVVIAEVKQPRVQLDSDFIRQMRQFGVRAGGLSKYCTGVCLLYDGVKQNNFKPQLREVAKVTRSEMIQ